MRRAVLFVLLPLLAWTLGCGEPAPAPPAAGGGEAAAADGDRSGRTTLSEIDELRSLPYLDFAAEEADPEERGVMLHDPERAWKGYNLYTLRGLCAAELIDMSGRVVNRWQVTACSQWARAELLPGGDLLVVGRARRKRVLLRLDFDGNVLWRRELDAHHDVEQTPSGRLLVLTMNPRAETVDGEAMTVRDDLLVLLDQDGGEIESVSLLDAFRRTEARTGGRILETVRSKRGAHDFFHANSIEWMDRPHLFPTHPLYDPRHVLVSIKHQDLVAIVDWDQRDLVWWWGRGELDGQHDATLLEDGNVLIYDNGIRREWGRALEIDPRTGEIVWEYRAEPKEKLYTRSLGAAQRLPNGNTLIAESERGHAFEVTLEGEVVWDFYVPHVNKRNRRATFVRMIRHEPGAIEELLRAQRRRRAAAERAAER